MLKLCIEIAIPLLFYSCHQLIIFLVVRPSASPCVRPVNII